MLYVVLYLPSVDNRCLNFMNTSLYSKEEKKRVFGSHSRFSPKDKYILIVAFQNRIFASFILLAHKNMSNFVKKICTEIYCRLQR